MNSTVADPGGVGQFLQSCMVKDITDIALTKAVVEVMRQNEPGKLQTIYWQAVAALNRLSKDAHAVSRGTTAVIVAKPAQAHIFLREILVKWTSNPRGTKPVSTYISGCFIGSLRAMTMLDHDVHFYPTLEAELVEFWPWIVMQYGPDLKEAQLIDGIFSRMANEFAKRAANYANVDASHLRQKTLAALLRKFRELDNQLVHVDGQRRPIVSLTVIQKFGHAALSLLAMTEQLDHLATQVETGNLPGIWC